MENNNGKGIFYGVIGVATLIVAIIGATFAYFTAQTTSSEYVQGTAATAGLDVNVVRMTGKSTSEPTVGENEVQPYIMVPQLDTTLDDAIVGTGGQECIDAGGSLVCSIYRIVVHNNGSAPITVSGTLDFYTSTNADGAQDPGTPPADDGSGAVAPAKGTNNLMNHLKWARLTQPGTVVDKQYTYDKVKSNSSELHGEMPTTLLTYANTVSNGKSGDEADSGYQLTSDGTLYKYAYTEMDDQPVNQHLYAIEVSGTTSTPVGSNQGKPAVNNIDLLNGYTVTGAHGRYTDLIDPTDDLLVDWTTTGTGGEDDPIVKTATATANPDATKGSWYLEANGTLGDTKVFYIVVWISENNQEQNFVDHGHFTGTVTFESSAGSGATSTFTEAV